MENKNKISRFLKSIDRFARNHKSEIIKEIKKIEKEEIMKAENGIIDDARSIIQKELLIMKSRFISKISAKNIENKKVISSKKNDIIQKIYDECKICIEVFVSTDEYFEKIKKSIEEILIFLNNDSVSFFVRSKDIEIKNIFPIFFLEKHKFYVDDTIKIGGIKAKFKNLIIDETYDSKLNEEIKSFPRNFGDCFRDF